MPGIPSAPGEIGRSVPAANLWTHVPAAIDWGGVDAYPDTFTAKGAAMYIRNFVLPKLALNQSLVLVPPLYGPIAPQGEDPQKFALDACGATDCDAEMVRWLDAARAFLQIEQGDRVAAIMAWHWTGVPEPGYYSLGGDDLPLARAAWHTYDAHVVAGAATESLTESIAL